MLCFVFSTFVASAVALTRVQHCCCSGIAPEAPQVLFQSFLTGVAMDSGVLSVMVTSFPIPTSLTGERKFCITEENVSIIVQRN